MPSVMSSSPEVRQRFEREAKTISQLSHPHICALYDVGREGDTEYLVMELLEGETLAERLVKGALPLDQTLRYGQEIADALDKAHRQGIVHRDLKPGNVMLTKSGVKLLDFGLAKTFERPLDAAGREQAAAGQDPMARNSLTALPTVVGNPLTREGTILGTFQYMAPEQLEGKDADARTDIFALGAVLYEMATGRKAYSGATQASLIGAILHTEPAPISTVQPTVPPGLERVVKTCLAKDPEDRWQSAHDVAAELKWIAQGSESGAPVASVARRRGGSRLAWSLAALATLFALAAAVAAVRSARRVPTLPLMRTSLVLPELSAPRAATLSPDGTKVVLVARDSSGRNLLWIRSLDSLAAQPLSGTEGSAFPFWSPDSRFVGFFADGKLKKISVEGGPAQTLCDAPISRGGSWGREGTILFAPVPDGPLYRVSAAGGAATAVTRFDPARGETSHRWPFFLPDGRHFLYLVASFGSGEEREKMGIYAGSLDSKEEKFLVTTKSTMAYAPPGYLLFLRERTLMAQAFDEMTSGVRGEPFPVADSVLYFPQTANSLFSVSNTGLLLYQAGSSQVLAQLSWRDRGGREVGSLGIPADQANPRISPDGKRVALDIIDHQTGNMDIWIYPSSGGVATRVTSDRAIDGSPVWSPDGQQIAFMSLRKGHPDVYLRSSSGAGSEECILESERAKYTVDWSPDARFVLFRAIDAKSNMELWALPVAGDRKPFPFLKPAFGVSHGQFSPDGRWVAYASNESGKWEIFVAPFPGPGGSVKVSAAGGSEPRWRRDGRELFYLAPDGKLMAVEVTPGSIFEAGAATPLFQTRRRVAVSSTDTFSYDVSADGQRFLVSNDVGEVTSSPLTVVLNWTAGLKK
jgi:serine/threonine protein kinase